jgi:hypothetical protein
MQRVACHMHRRTLVHRFALGCRSGCFTWNGRARGDTIPSNPDSAQPHPRVIARQSQGSGPARFHVDRRDRATTALDITPAVSRETSMPCRAVLSSIRAAPASCRRVIGLRTTGCVTGLWATESPGERAAMNLPRTVGATLGCDMGLSRRRRIAPVVHADRAARRNGNPPQGRTTRQIAQTLRPPSRSPSRPADPPTRPTTDPTTP